MSDLVGVMLFAALMYGANRIPARGVHRIADALERIAKALEKA